MSNTRWLLIQKLWVNKKWKSSSQQVVKHLFSYWQQIQIEEKRSLIFDERVKQMDLSAKI